ncbi:thiosulfate reductase [Salmonella enterica subsp. enterica serovar Paratyphi A]|nr:thiosulfate reductase [Salmonella enterica subsp. enterica serovar Paratyphi A]
MARYSSRGDLAVLLAMCHVMIDEQLYDASFVERYTSGFEQLAQAVKETTPEWAAAQADVPADVIVRVTRELAACAPHAIVSPGHRATFSQEEIDMRRMIFTLNVLLGNIEREGGLYQKKTRRFTTNWPEKRSRQRWRNSTLKICRNRRRNESIWSHRSLNISPLAAAWCKALLTRC